MAEPQLMASFFNLDFQKIGNGKEFQTLIENLFNQFPLPPVKDEASKMIMVSNLSPVFFKEKPRVATRWNLNNILTIAIKEIDLIQETREELKDVFHKIKKAKRAHNGGRLNGYCRIIEKWIDSSRRYFLYNHKRSKIKTIYSIVLPIIQYELQ